MINKENGGPAFPAPDAARARFGETESDAFMGMTLRDYFAAKADPDDVVEILSEHYDAWCDAGTTRTPEYHKPSRAEARYMFADAMLVERTK